MSNILLDSQLLPLVSDAFLYNLNENGPINDSNNEMIDYIVSIPPELLQNKDYTFKSDIYSFGILTLQILTNRINVYVDKTIKCSEIIQLKQNGHLPNLSDVKNQKLRDLINQCLDSDPEKRPTTNKIIDTIKKIEDDENEYDIQRLNNTTIISTKSPLTSQNNHLNSDIKNNVIIHSGNIFEVLRFSVLWNDIGNLDKNDLNAHCMQPNNVELYYRNKYDKSTTGSLDVDIRNPKQGKPAFENIAWIDKNKMCNGTYRFYVHQYADRNGRSGFRAQIEFDDKIYSYDYRSTFSEPIFDSFHLLL